MIADTSKEYASALFELAVQSGSEAEVSDALSDVLKLTDENPDYLKFLASPAIPKSERLAAIREAFSDFLPEPAVSFLLLLCEHGQIGSFPECVKEYKELSLRAHQISRARIVSAVSLTPEEKKRLHRILEKQSGHTVIAEYSCDPAILGGISVLMDGKIYDGSLKYRLKQAKEVMNHEP